MSVAVAELNLAAYTKRKLLRDSNKLQPYSACQAMKSSVMGWDLSRQTHSVEVWTFKKTHILLFSSQIVALMVFWAPI